MTRPKFGEWGGPSVQTLLLEKALQESKRADDACASDAYDTAREARVVARAFAYAASFGTNGGAEEAIALYDRRPRHLGVSRDDAAEAISDLRTFSEKLREGKL